MKTIDVKDLTFAPIREDDKIGDNTIGSFVRSENLDRYLTTEVGKAQVTSIHKEAAQQMGNPDYELSIAQVRKILFSEQAAQDHGGKPDVTNKEMIAEHGPSSLMELGDLTTNFLKEAKEWVEDGAKAALGVIYDGVANNGAGATIQNRSEALDRATESQTPPSPGPG